ncbi:response regulator transcription factor [Ruminococcus flavefaciens]|uniref:response regulator transcription factor n=1 Tax=Ruminococcus flavefaciens TaxID=1265 RepID=UPI0004668C37|nr:response regulator transcription factor [Ruminococcus flavefaciens]
MEEKYRILLAEDEKGLRDITALFLRKNGFDVDTAADGNEAALYAEKNRYDIIVLDIMMPGRDGKEVCKAIRKSYDVPVIFLTALGEENDIVEGYEVGADEYMTKPFSTKLLLVKIKALIKRYHGLIIKNGILKIGELEIEPARRYVTVNGKEAVMAPKEYELLMYFIDNKNIALSRDRILDSVWGIDYEGVDRAVDTHVKKLRAALGAASCHIETVIKIGYMWKD